ncbi:unnamed protein product [Boreogadus saida]
MFGFQSDGLCFPPWKVLSANVFLERRRADGGAVNLEDDINHLYFTFWQDLHLLTQSQTSTSCQKSSRTAER